MAEYIGRETFLKDIEERYCLPCKEAGKDYNGCKCRACWVDDMRGDVIDAPAADVVQVVHGRWEWIGPYRYNDDGMIGTCSVCKERLRLFAYNYCPNCGAKMDGDSDAKAD